VRNAKSTRLVRKSTDLLALLIVSLFFIIGSAMFYAPSLAAKNQKQQQQRGNPARATGPGFSSTG